MSKRTVLLVFILAIAGNSVAQLSGQTPASASQVYNYEYLSGSVIPIPVWEATNGTIGTKTQTGLHYTADITWNQTGTQTVRFYNNTTLLATYNVTVRPGAPSVSNGNRCGTGTVALSATTGTGGTTCKWYSAITGGTLLATSTSYTTPSISATTTYYVTSYNSSWGETVTRTPVVATVNSPPGSSPSVAGNARFGEGILDLTASGASGGNAYNWFDPTDHALGSGSVYHTPYLSTTTSNYLYATIFNGCNGPKTWVTATIYPKPLITGSHQIVNGNSNTLDAGPGYDTYTWKNAANSTVATSQTYSTSAQDTYRVTVTKNSLTSSASDPFTLGGQFYGQDENYIVSNTMTVDSIFTLAAVDVLPAESNLQNIQYFDGLGRLVQTVVTQGSPSKKDIVSPIAYDVYGRDYRKFLPFADGANGWMQTEALDGSNNYTGAALTFYTSASKVAVETQRPFSETVYEQSALNRPIQNFGPGQAWYSGNKSIVNQYPINQHGTSTNQEKIIAWHLNASTGFPERSATSTNIVTGGYYATGQLQIKVIVDEQGNSTREYVDREGQVVLKKVQVASSTDLNNTGQWALTYYVYDELHNLRYVLQPELTKIIHANDSNNPTSTNLVNYAFQYRYDTRRRMIMKRIPGADSVLMVYDKRDRLVMTQDGNQRPNKQWHVTKYDSLNRSIVSAIYTHATSVSQMTMSGLITSKLCEVYNGAISTHGYTNTVWPTANLTVLAVSYYDKYDFVADLALGPEYDYVNTDIGGQESTRFAMVTGQSTGSKVNILGTTKYLWSVVSFDSKYRVTQTVTTNTKFATDRTTNLYDFTGKVRTTKTTHNKKNVTWVTDSGVIVGINKLTRSASGSGWGTSGAVSGQQLAASTDGWMELTVSETNTNRMIGLADTNPDLSYTSIDFCFYLNTTTLTVYENGVAKYTESGVNLVTGDVLRIERSGTTIAYKKNGITKYTSLSSSTSALMVDASIGTLGGTLSDVRTSFPTSRIVTRQLEYDHVGRHIKTWHQLDAQTEILLVKNEYNEIGQLVDKKLHSALSDASDAMQSIDYRYNIRGWLTKINESDIETGTSDATNSGEKRDLFGMELGYNADMGTSNDLLYNGNISAIKWSKDLALGTVKQDAYNYGYDKMNRITAATFKEKSSSWALASNSAFSESSYTYDLNGNILTLLRYDKRGTSTALDNLTYNYGTITSNRLLKVSDSGDKYKGFIDGTNTGDDYGYDANGNMITDQNKGITTSITYNYLNLPELVKRAGSTGNSVQYVYDASGRKLSQTVTFNGTQKQTDYVGEFVYENDVLQFVLHEEGRIAIAGVKTVSTDDASSNINYTVNGSCQISTVTQNGETYTKVAANGTTAKSGAFPIGETIHVVAGERYKIRARGYRDKGTAASSSNAYLRIQTGGADLDWLGATLPVSLTTATTETWIEQVVTIPAGATTLQAGVTWNTVLTGEAFYIDDFEIVNITSPTPEYQYNLKDHLGNVRLTFGTQRVQNIYTAGYEDANISTESATFSPSYGNAVKVNAALYNHTPSGSKSQRLSGANQNEIIGLAKSFKVIPGDTLDIEVYTKYFTPTATSTNMSGLLLTSMSSAFGVSAGSAGEPLRVYQTLSSMNTAGTLLTTGGGSGGAPKAFLNYILFDEDFVAYDVGFSPVTTAALETGTGVSHLKLTLQAKPSREGYAYIYVSNEHSVVTDVYFDDFKVTQIKSPVIQSDDYYSGGSRFNSYSRENSLFNKRLYNAGSEIQADLGLDVYQTHYRFLDTWILRWWQVDPKPSDAISVYAAMDNNPILHNDPLGDIVDIKYGGFLGIGRKTVTYGDDGKLTKNGQAFTGKVGGFLGKAVGALNNIRALGGQTGVSQLVNSANTFNIQRGSNGFTASNPMNAQRGLTGQAGTVGSGGTIRWSPGNNSGGPNQAGNNSRPSFIGLAHEVGHGMSADQGRTDYSHFAPTNPDANLADVRNDENNAVHFENTVRVHAGVPLRTHYTKDASGAGFMQFLNPGTNVNSQTGNVYQSHFSVPGPLQQFIP